MAAISRGTHTRLNMDRRSVRWTSILLLLHLLGNVAVTSSQSAPLDCGRPPTLADGDTKGSSQFRYRHNDRVEHMCQSYYVMQGGPFRTCINGEWTGDITCLKPCTVDTEAMNGRNITFRYSRDNKLYANHDDHVAFRCTRGRPVGRVAMRQRCDDGVMELPSCF